MGMVKCAECSFEHLKHVFNFWCPENCPRSGSGFGLGLALELGLGGGRQFSLGPIFLEPNFLIFYFILIMQNKLAC